MAVSGTQLNLTGDGNTASVQVAGPVNLSLTNDFGSGTAKLQRQLPDATWVDVAGASYTAAADALIDFPVTSNNVVRVNLASSTSPDLDILIQSDADDAS